MSGKTIVISQSDYVPWKGYFDLIAAADEFLIFDEVQFTRRDWRNRNKIIVGGRTHWLTVPVRSRGHYFAPVNAMEVVEGGWAKDHWSTIRHSYRRAPYWDQISPILEKKYREAATLRRLTEINELFLRAIAELLGLSTVILRAEMVPRTSEDATARLLEICQARGATAYLSGPAARNYIRPNLFADAGITLRYADYSDYPSYEQAMAPIEHGVSILDVLFQCGKEGAREHLKAIVSPGNLRLPE